MFIRPVFLLSHIRKIVKNESYFCHELSSFWLSVCLSVLIDQLDRFSRHSMFEEFLKIFLQNKSFIEIWQD